MAKCGAYTNNLLEEYHWLSYNVIAVALFFSLVLFYYLSPYICNIENSQTSKGSGQEFKRKQIRFGIFWT